MGRVMRRFLPIIAAGVLLVGLVPVAAAATWADFGTPTAESSFETGIRFNQPVTVTVPAGRAELLLTIGDAIGPTVIEVQDPPAGGDATLTHALVPADGHILPNTPLVARWRLVAADDPTDVQLGPEIRLVYADDRFDWKTAAGDVVRVHWTDGSDAFGRRALRIAEDAIEETSALLGVTETAPVDFFIYADQEAFRDAIGPGLRESVGGLAVASIRTLFALIQPAQIDDVWVGIVIPHELSHLVFDTASGNPYHFPPHWLNEGVADYVSQGYDADYRRTVRDAARSGTLIPLDGLTGQFPTTPDRFYLAYAESVSAVDYMVRIYGADALVQLIRSYADGRTDDEAFTAALGVDMTAFADAWLEDVDAEPPTRFGPQPAPGVPAPTGNGVPAPTADVAELPGWMPALVAAAGIGVVALLLVATRRDRASRRRS